MNFLATFRKWNTLSLSQQRMTNKLRHLNKQACKEKCRQWPVFGLYWWEAKRSLMFAPLFPLGFIYFQTIVFLHRLLQLSQPVSLWSHRKIHCVSLNHQSAGGEKPLLLCGPPRCSLKNSTNAAGKQSSLWPSHSSDALLVTALRHIIRLALVLEVPDLSCGGVLKVCVRGEEGGWGQLPGHWHLHHTASTGNLLTEWMKL